MLAIADYRLKHPEQIETPAFLVFEEYLDHNIRRVLEICGSPGRIVPHFKTHKSSDVLKRTLAAGIRSYKCATLREAEVLAESGVKEITLAYPLAHPLKARRFFALKRRFPDPDLRTIASQERHLEVLSAAAADSGQSIGIYVDLDTGMHRTGVRPGEEAIRFWARAARLPRLRVLGIHLFDGHTGFKPGLQDRRQIVQEGYRLVLDLWERARRESFDVVDNLVGNSWSFHLYPRAEFLRLSPGTWIYWDHRNAMMEELPFRYAALVLGQVVDADPVRDTVTVDIGSKAISDDVAVPLRFKVLGHESMDLVAQSEEHGVMKLNGAVLNVGDFFFAVPGHACTATVKYPHALVVNGEGEVSGRYGHDARDRDADLP